MWMCKLMARWLENEERLRPAWVERHLRCCHRCQQKEQLNLVYHRLVEAAREMPLPLPQLEWSQIRNRLASTSRHLPTSRFRWAFAGVTAILLVVATLTLTPRFWETGQRTPLSPAFVKWSKEGAKPRLPLLSERARPPLEVGEEQRRSIQPPRLASAWLAQPSVETTERKPVYAPSTPHSPTPTPREDQTSNQLVALPLTPIQPEGEKANYLQITVRAEEENVYSF